MAKKTSTPVLTVAGLQPQLLAALRAWHTGDVPAAGPLTALLLVRARQAALAGADGSANRRRALNEVLLAGLDELLTTDPRGAQVLRLRYLDAQLTKQVAHRLNASVDQVNRLQRAALRGLAELLLRQELQLRDQRAAELEAALPPPACQRLVGFDGAGTALEGQLLKPDAPWLVQITGLGGIGKTALADMVARRVIRHFHFDRVLWVRAAPADQALPPSEAYDQLLLALAAVGVPDLTSSPAGRLARLRQLLKEQPHLVIFDNLEAEALTAYCLEHLPALAAPSKFLLTSRARSVLASAYNWSPPELDLGEAEALIRDQAALAGPDLAGALTSADTQAIFRVVGGNPLALKLVVGLLVVQPLAEVLRDLEQARAGAAEDLYRHIYWRAWRSLSVEARALLQAMPLVAEVGAAPAQLHAISGLTEAQLWPAVMELWTRSLLEARGTPRDKRYGIHRLTETFLRTEIIHWAEVG